MSMPTTLTTGSSAVTLTWMSSELEFSRPPRARVLQDPTLKENADNPLGIRLWYHLHQPDRSLRSTTSSAARRSCTPWTTPATRRRMVVNLPVETLATTLLPPTIPGHTDFDLYPNGPDHKGDLDAAKKSLEACGQPNGFETNIGYRAERPKEKATAEAFQQALGRVGIKLTLKPYPQGDYFAQYCGLPPYVVKNKLGLCTQRLGGRLA